MINSIKHQQSQSSTQLNTLQSNLYSAQTKPHTLFYLIPDLQGSNCNGLNLFFFRKYYYRLKLLRCFKPLSLKTYLHIKLYHQHYNNHYNVQWDTLHIYDSWQCQYLIINLIDQFNKLSILESENLYFVFCYINFYIILWLQMQIHTHER